jgi:hypothetical protein
MFWDTTGKSGIFNALTHKIDGYLCQPPAAAQCEARDCKHPVHLELNLESELQGDDIRPHRSSLSPPRDNLTFASHVSFMGGGRLCPRMYAMGSISHFAANDRRWVTFPLPSETLVLLEINLYNNISRYLL